MHVVLVPTLRVGMPSSTLCVVFRPARRPLCVPISPAQMPPRSGEDGIPTRSVGTRESQRAHQSAGPRERPHQ